MLHESYKQTASHFSSKTPLSFSLSHSVSLSLSLYPHFGYLPASLYRNRLIFSFIQSTNISLIFIVMKIVWYKVKSTLDFIIVIIIIFFYVRCVQLFPVDQALP